MHGLTINEKKKKTRHETRGQSGAGGGGYPPKKKKFRPCVSLNDITTPENEHTKRGLEPRAPPNTRGAVRKQETKPKRRGLKSNLRGGSAQKVHYSSEMVHSIKTSLSQGGEPRRSVSSMNAKKNSHESSSRGKEEHYARLQWPIYSKSWPAEE